MDIDYIKELEKAATKIKAAQRIIEGVRNSSREMYFFYCRDAGTEKQRQQMQNRYFKEVEDMNQMMEDIAGVLCVIDGYAK